MKIPTASLIVIALLAMAAPAKAQEIVPAREYRACMKLARDNPDLGFGHATSWLGLDGGDAAHHCQAVALVGLGQHSEGARRFEELAQERSGRGRPFAPSCLPKPPRLGFWPASRCAPREC